jgi:hypothetical protein
MGSRLGRSVVEFGVGIWRFPANMRRRHRNFRCGIWHLNPNLNALLIERRAAPSIFGPQGSPTVPTSA